MHDELGVDIIAELSELHYKIGDTVSEFAPF